MFKKRKIILSRKGFTLVEALVAISILMVAVTSPMMIAQKSLSTAVLTKDQMTASFLTQDAIEAIKNIRDNILINASPTTDWITGDANLQFGLEKCICSSDTECNFDNADGTINLSAKYCNIDTTNTILDSNSIIGSADNNIKINPLKIDLDSNRNFIKYDLSGTTPSKFSRKFNIKKQMVNDKRDEAVISVRVSWNSTFGVQNIDVKNFIYNISEKIQ